MTSQLIDMYVRPDWLIHHAQQAYTNKKYIFSTRTDSMHSTLFPRLVFPAQENGQFVTYMYAVLLLLLYSLFSAMVSSLFASNQSPRRKWPPHSFIHGQLVVTWSFGEPADQHALAFSTLCPRSWFQKRELWVTHSDKYSLRGLLDGRSVVSASFQARSM